MEKLLKPFPQVAELLVGAVLAEQHEEWAEARPKGESGGTKFAQGLLRNAGQLVCIDPSLGMAEFRYKSDINSSECYNPAPGSPSLRLELVPRIAGSITQEYWLTIMTSWSDRLRISLLAALIVLATLGVLGFLSSNSPAVAQGTLTAPTNVTAVSDAASELTLTWEGGDNADSFLLIAVHLETYDYETETVAGGVVKTGTVTGLTGGANYLGIVVALQATADGLQTLYGIAAVQSATTSAATDRATLVALYNAAGGANWANNSKWLSDAPLDQWYGVTTDTNGRVSDLNLRYNRMSGTIPPTLGNLSDLIYLDLQGNQLSGTIPSELGNLSNLTILRIDSNQLSGTIPSDAG